jgi:hypothetical protein
MGRLCQSGVAFVWARICLKLLKTGVGENWRPISSAGICPTARRAITILEAFRNNHRIGGPVREVSQADATCPESLKVGCVIARGEPTLIKVVCPTAAINWTGKERQSMGKTSLRLPHADSLSRSPGGSGAGRSLGTRTMCCQDLPHSALTARPVNSIREFQRVLYKGESESW